LKIDKHKFIRTESVQLLPRFCGRALQRNVLLVDKV